MNFNDDDSILYDDENSLRQPPPFNNFNPPPFTPGGNPPPFTPGGNPPSFSPGGNPPSNFPMGGNVNIGPPPQFTPSKNSPGVKSLTSPQKGGQGINPKAVSPGSISFCLFKFTYIWERGNRNYWTYLLNVDRRSISGFRWFRGRWVFFGLDLNRIDSFICYRGDSESETRDKSDNDIIFLRKQYTTTKISNIYFKTLANFEVIESRNDYITDYIGEVDGNEVTSKIPCKQSKVTNYRIILEISYPDSFSKDLIKDINTCANEASILAIENLNTFRDIKDFLTPLEVFNNTTKNINKSIKVFSDEFSNKIKKIKVPKETLREIKYSISEEKLEGPWRVF